MTDLTPHVPAFSYSDYYEIRDTVRVEVGEPQRVYLRGNRTDGEYPAIRTIAERLPMICYVIAEWLRVNSDGMYSHRELMQWVTDELRVEESTESTVIAEFPHLRFRTRFTS